MKTAAIHQRVHVRKKEDEKRFKVHFPERYLVEKRNRLIKRKHRWQFFMALLISFLIVTGMIILSAFLAALFLSFTYKSIAV